MLQEAGRSAEQLVENGRRRAEAIIEKAQQQAEQLRADVTDEAQKVLEQARGGRADPPRLSRSGRR